MLTLYGLALFGVGPSLVAMARDYQVPLGRLGTLFTSFFIGFTLGVLATGYLAQRHGKRPLALAGLGLLAGSLLLFALAPASGSYPLALLAIALVGVGGAVTETTASALITDLNPRRAAFALNLSQGFFGAGAITGPLLVGSLLGHGLSWRLHFYLSAALVALLLAALIPQQVEEKPADPATWRQLASLARHPALLLSALAMTLYIGAEIGYSGWISAYLERVLAAPPARASQAVAWYWVGMTAGRLLAGWAAERLGPERLVALLGAAGTLACLATSLAGSASLGLVLAAAAGLAMSGVFASILTAASDHFPGSTATVFGLVMTAVGVGGMTFPAAMGVVADGIGLRAAMVVPAGLLLALSLTMLRLRRLRPQPGQA